MGRAVRYAALAIAILLAAGCATRKRVAEKGKEPVAVESREALLKGIRSAQFFADTAERRVNMSVGGKSVGGTMRLVRGQRLWLNISMLGITFARGMFTPDSLMYYERVNKTAFAGRWEELYGISPLLRAVDYSVVENLVCGRPVFALDDENYAGGDAESYVFSQKGPSDGFTMVVSVDKNTLRVVSQGMVSPDGKVGLLAEYTYSDSDSFPRSALFSVSAAGGEKAVRLDFTPVKKMQPDFPFRVPEGFSDAREFLRPLGVNI